MPSAVVRGVCGQALPLPRRPALWACCWGPSPKCCGCVCVGVGAQHCPLGLHALWGVRSAGVVGGASPGGVACHRCEACLVSGAVPPPPPVLWSGQPGFRDPFVPGADGAGVGTQPRTHNVHPCGLALLAMGVAEGCPRGGCLPPLSGASVVRRPPSPDSPPSGRAVGVRRPHAVAACVWVWGPNTVPLACMPCGACVPRGWWGGRPRGGLPATVVRRVWSQALSHPRPPVLWSGRPGFRDPFVPGADGAGVGTQHRPDSVRPCGLALLAVGVAKGHPRGGCPPPL